jgi:hypothetical protein
MAKLKLDLDSLTVESFETTEQDQREGTVHGAQATLATCMHSCFTCALSCFRTCDASCQVLSCHGTCSPTCFTCGTSCHQVRTCGASCQHLTCGFSCLGQTCHISCPSCPTCFDRCLTHPVGAGPC